MEEWSVCLPEHHPGYVSWPEYLQTRERLREQRETARRGRRRRPRRRRAAAGPGALRALRAAHAGQLCRNQRDRPRAMRACAATSCMRTEPDLPVARRRPPRRRPSPPRSWRRSPRPASRATAGAVRELQDQHDELARRAAPRRRARRVRSRPRAPPVRRLRARAPTRRAHPRSDRSRTRSPSVERERGKLAALEQARPAPMTDAERAALARLARDLPRLWNAPTTTDRDRKELLRTLVSDVIVTVHAAEQARRRRDLLGRRRPHRARGARSTPAAPSDAGCPRTRSS